jgi:hypothetical protein
MLSSGQVFLDGQGDPNAVFIFQIGSTLTTLSGTQVVLSGGTQAKNVFWQVSTSATLGTNPSSLDFGGQSMGTTSLPLERWLGAVRTVRPDGRYVEVG